MAYTPADVNAWFQAVQFRDGPTATVASYVSLLNAGTLTPASVQNSIITDVYTTVNVNSVIRLYQGAFARVPDQAGQNYWADTMGATPDALKPAQLQSIANGFASSQEFIATYGNVQGASAPINSAILTAFYANILNRAPDATGMAYWLSSGQNVGQVLNAFSQSTEFTASSKAATVQFQQAEIAGNPATSGSLFQYGGFPGTTYVLTTGVDTATANTFVGVIGQFMDNTFSPGDTLTGAQLSGNTLNLSDGGAAPLTQTAITPAGATLTNIQNLVLNSGNAFTNLSTAVAPFAGIKSVQATGVGGIGFTGGSAQSLNITDTEQGGSAIAINGGSGVTLTTTATGALNSGVITVGSVAAPVGAGAISIVQNANLSGAFGSGPITTNGGSTVNIVQNGVNSVVNTTLSLGSVTVNGTASTTGVTVKQTASVTASAQVAGIANGAVQINDVNYGSATKIGTIATASINGYNGVAFNGTSLATLSVANGKGNIIIDNSGLTTPVTKTLALTINNVTSGTLDDADIYTTLNVTTSGANSTLSNITTGGVTALNVAGSNVLALSSAAGLTALKTVVVTGAAGVSGDFSGATVTSVDSSASSGAVAVTVDATKATFKGGSGASTVTLLTAAPTKTIAAGSGSTDTLSISAANAATASATSTFASFVTGFEALTLTGATNQTIDLVTLGGYKAVSTAGGNGLTLNGFVNGGTLTLTGAGTAYTLANSDWTAGPSDSVNVALKDGSGVGVAFAATGITAANLESMAITVADTQATPSGTFNDTLTLLGNSLKTITVSGNAGLTLTATDTALTSLDASGITGTTTGGLSFTSGALVSAATITGSAKGLNTVIATAATKAVTYIGGSGGDDVTINNAQANNVSLGDGTNTFTGGNGNNTVNGGIGVDMVTVGNGNNTISTFAGNDLVQVGTGANTIDVGDGNDNVSVGASLGTNNVNVGAGTDTIVLLARQSSGGAYTLVTGMGAGDLINESATKNGVPTPATLGAKVQLGGAAAFSDYLNASVTVDGSVNSVFNWFQYSGNTYIVTDNGAGGTFTNGVDQVIGLTGLVDLSTSTQAGGVITLV